MSNELIDKIIKYVDGLRDDDDTVVSVVSAIDATYLDTIDENMLRKVFPNAGDRLTPHLPYIVPAMKQFNINTPNRVTAFLAQLAHESGEYRYMEELADGSDYEGRTDLGNIYPGDGIKFKGHGPIQITGRNNHIACGQALGLDLVANPRLICQPEYGTLSSAWFWSTHDLNYVAEQNWFKVTTRIINGGYNGLESRIKYWNNNRVVFGLPFIDINNENASIKDFQSKNGLVADGDCGPKTIAKLKEVS